MHWILLVFKISQKGTKVYEIHYTEGRIKSAYISDIKMTKQI